MRFFKHSITKIKLALAAVGMMAAATQVWAQSGQAQGGLPGGYLITDRWRQVYSQYSGVTNPAFVNEENYMSLRFLFSNMQEIFYMTEFGFAMPIGLYDAVGVSWIMQGTSNYEATDDAGEATGQSISDQGHFIALTYANKVWNGLTVGGNINIIAQNISGDRTLTIAIPSDNGSGKIVNNERVTNNMRYGFGVDIGLTYNILRHQMWGNHIIGLSTNNIVNMIMDTDEKYAAAVRFSLISDFWKKRICYGADFVLKDLLAGDEGDWNNDDPNKAIKGKPWELTQKLGANILRIFKLYGLVGLNNEGLEHYGFALGAKMSFQNFRSIEGMMQFVSITNGDGDANASHITFYARTEFGKHREETYIRK